MAQYGIVLLLSAPSDIQINQFLDKARESSYTYSEVGATSGLLPPLFTPDQNRVQLGKGAQTWRNAVQAIEHWEMFSIPWVRLYWPTTPIAAEQNVAVLAHHLGCYWLNACRIVYVVDDDGEPKRFGFAYGTLTDHAESGEERFLVEWNRNTDEVTYDLLAFSRPNQFLVRMGYPFARQLQKRFVIHSIIAMKKAVGGS
jgi:uncharacterized protein (UPF0548 family)